MPASAAEQQQILPALEPDAAEVLAQNIFNIAADAIIALDANYRIILFNQGAESIFGYGAGEVIGQPLDKLLPRKHVETHRGHIERFVQAEQTARKMGERREVHGRRKDGSVFPAEASISKIMLNGQMVFTAIVRDVTERKAIEAHLTHMAFTDPLTDLPNRALLNNRLECAFARSARRYARVGLLLLDLDRFKTINDSLGHHYGDALLVEVSRRLSRCVRAEDTLCRLGGDEFVVLLEEVDETREAINVARRIVKQLQEPFDILGQSVYATASVGVAIGAPPETQSHVLLMQADAALYQAKEQGRNRYVIHGPDGPPVSRQRLDLETDLHTAAQNGEFRLEYQPIVALWNGDFAGAEALLRWHRPGRRPLRPGHFLSLAEEIGLFGEISKWVIREACAQASQWRDLCTNVGGMRIAVNVSPTSFRTPDLVPTIEAALRENALDPTCLELEILETALMEDNAATMKTISKLRRMGVHFALDDFGTGYSSLNNLRGWKVDKLKIDRSFVADIEKPDGTLPVIESVVSLAHALGMSVTAEGIETEDQLALLRVVGCDFGQGHLFSKPIKPRALSSRLALGQLHWPLTREDGIAA